MERLNALYEYAVLDTPPEADFDELTLLASTVCETPIALISLIDSDRQWFKSCVGVNMRETPRDLSFCTHAIRHDGIFVVPNALEDERFRDNPMVTQDPKIRFYAGVSLLSPQGLALGTLCVIDRVPRQLTATQTHTLEILARQVVSQLELRRMHRQAVTNMTKLHEAALMVATNHARITHANRMSALGLMASEMAHEINNPLAIIAGKAHQLSTAFHKNSMGREDILRGLQIIEYTTKRIAKVVRDLMDFTRDGGNDLMERVDARDLGTTACQMIGERFKFRNIKLHWDMPAKPYMVEVRRQQIQHVLYSLLDNAYEAVKDLHEPWVRLRLEEDGESVVFRCEDSGAGVPVELRGKIMLPFFTTKNSSEYAGLGLSISKGIAEDHGGRLSYDSTSPHTSFCLSLPKVLGMPARSHAS